MAVPTALKGQKFKLICIISRTKWSPDLLVLGKSLRRLKIDHPFRSVICSQSVINPHNLSITCSQSVFNLEESYFRH